MKKYLSPILLLVVSLFGQACSEDEPKKKESTVNHVGTPWKISSVTYTLIDQNLSNPGQAVKTGTATDAGTFYFDGTKGSFDIKIEGIEKEDVFSYQEDAADVSITSVSQNVSGAALSQHVIALSGDKLTATTMTLSGTITKQSLTGQFALTGTFNLVKQ
jgi:ABC-type proline/glycine betaine transport system substrate-binding protein